MDNNITIPDSVIDRYEILMPFDTAATAFLVKDRLTDELVVEKIVSVQNPDLYQMLKDHSFKGVPQIYRIESVNEKTILIEEYIHGLNLAQVVRNEGSLPESLVLSYMMQLCDILDQFHKMSPQIIHRDIKPDNIILSNDSNIFLIDFNISRKYNPYSALDTVALISRHFSAPESYGFGQTDSRSDIYSIGATMHYLLTGGYLKETSYMGSMKDIISKCTMMDPDRRYQSVRELKTAFDKNLGLSFASVRTSRLKRFFPPGFRTGQPIKMVIAALGYVLIGWLCFTMEIEPQLSGPLSIIEIWLERISSFVFFIVSILLIFDYRGWLEKLPGIEKINSRILKTGLSIFILFSLLLSLMVILVSIMTSL